MGFFGEINELVIKFTGKGKGIRILHSTLEKQNKTEALTLLDFKTLNKEVVWYWCWERQRDPWNRRQPRKKKTHMWWTGLDKEANTIKQRKSSLSIIDMLTIYIHLKDVLQSIMQHVLKITSKWSIHINVKPKIINFEDVVCWNTWSEV